MKKQNEIPESSCPGSGSFSFSGMSNTFFTLLYLLWAPLGSVCGTLLPVWMTILSAVYQWPLCFPLTRRLTQFPHVCVSAQRVSSPASNTFPTAECVIVALLSSLLTVFFNGFPDELGHCSQEAIVRPIYCLTGRRATSDDFLPVTLRATPIIPEQQTRRHMFMRFFTEITTSNSKRALKGREKHCTCLFKGLVHTKKKIQLLKRPWNPLFQ